VVLNMMLSLILLINSMNGGIDIVFACDILEE